MAGSANVRLRENCDDDQSHILDRSKDNETYFNKYCVWKGGAVHPG